MIRVDESDPIEDETPEPTLPQKDVTIKRGIDANEHYEFIEEIGRGKFGTVYNCREKSTGRKLAAKSIPIPKRDDRRNVEREVEIMNSLQHPKIIQLFDAYEYCKNMWVILELIEGGELFERVIDDNYLLTEKACIVIIRQVCEAMEFIHRNSILHLDLKPENILCTTREGNRIKLIDFGLARKYDPDKKLQVLFGTPEFVAPEVVNFDRISFGTDMWSVGVICYVLLSGLSPFMGENDIETMTNVTISKYDFDDEAFHDISPEATNFISKLLIKDINDRMTASECLTHIWLKRRPNYNLRPQLAPKPIMLPPLKFKPITSPSIILPVSPVSPHKIQLLEPAVISSPPIINDIEAKLENSILNKSKENLKEFVQRWGEHPNSPYIFDRENNYITPPIQLELKPNSNLSSRGCSPSPCESNTSTNRHDIENNEENNQNSNNDSNPLNSDNNNEVLQNIDGTTDTDNSNENDNINNIITDCNVTVTINNDSNNINDKNNENDKEMDDYIESIERRRSDSKCPVSSDKNYDQINLADEIKKLSERLLSLSQMNIDIGISATSKNQTNTSSPEFIDKNTINNEVDCNKPEQNGIINKNITDEKNEETCEPIKPELRKKPEFYKSKLNEAYNHNVQLPNQSLKQSLFRSMRSNSSSFDKLEEKYLADRSARSDVIHYNAKNFTTSNHSVASSEGSNSFHRRFATSKDSIFSQSFNGTETLNSIKSPVWASSVSPSFRRTKFRINHSSRDVPLAPTSHQHSSIIIEDSAKATKDCLLKLLEKYDRNSSSNNYSSNNFTKSSKSSLSSSSSTTSLNYNTVGRHQSISVEWGISDNLENQTMNSINAFFHRYGNRNNGCVKKIQTQIESRNNQ